MCKIIIVLGYLVNFFNSLNILESIDLAFIWYKKKFMCTKKINMYELIIIYVHVS